MCQKKIKKKKRARGCERVGEEWRRISPRFASCFSPSTSTSISTQQELPPHYPHFPTPSQKEKKRKEKHNTKKTNTHTHTKTHFQQNLLSTFHLHTPPPPPHHNSLLVIFLPDCSAARRFACPPPLPRVLNGHPHGACRNAHTLTYLFIADNTHRRGEAPRSSCVGRDTFTLPAFPLTLPNQTPRSKKNPPPPPLPLSLNRCVHLSVCVACVSARCC